MPGRTGPQFLGIGAQKAGTTWLHENFSHHPRIWMPHEKEIHYFDEKLDRPRAVEEAVGSDSPWAARWRRQVRRQLRNHARDPASTDLVWCARFFVEQPDDDWYRSLFVPGSHQVSGEFTPDYALLTRSRIRRIADMNPEMRILYMLRNPIERAWSAALMADRINSATTNGDGYIELVSQPRIRAHSAYAAALDRWLSVFPPEQIFLGYLEDVSFHPRRLLAAVYRFLGVDDVEYGVLTRKIHAGGSSTIPTSVAVRLAEEYHEELVQLADRLGGYAGTWLSIADELLDRPPSTPSIRYPFWESDLVAAGGYRPSTGGRRRPQSGPLG